MPPATAIAPRRGLPRALAIATAAACAPGPDAAPLVELGEFDLAPRCPSLQPSDPVPPPHAVALVAFSNPNGSMSLL